MAKKRSKVFLLPLIGVAVSLTLVAFFLNSGITLSSKIVSAAPFQSGVKKTSGVQMSSTSALVVASPKPTRPPHIAPANSGRSVSVPILYYHYIGNNPNPADKTRDALSVSPDKFEAQMNYIATNSFTPISFDTLYAALKGGQLPAKPIIITFDDGYIDFYYNAYPVLKRYNLQATAFIPTGLIGQGYYLNWSQIKEMDASGLVIFEAHSVNHPNLIALTNDQDIYQITESKKVLEAQLGKKVNFFAYPYGASNDRIWADVKNAGFFGATGTWGGKIESEGNIFDMPRIRVGSNWTLPQFASRI